jgi:phosphatidylethanolamine/phosphatidyl-N-methylethanolamine N-methyltransferase
MDASKLAFADASFDVAVAMFVMTVAPGPVAMMQVRARVTKSGGTVSLSILQDQQILG